MKRKSSVLSVALSLVMLLNLVLPVYADAMSSDINKVEQQVLESLDNSPDIYDSKMICDAINNAQATREWSSWRNDTYYASYKTEDPNIKVVLNGYDVDVVQKLSDFEFLVNGERVTITMGDKEMSSIEVAPESLRAGWIEIGDPGMSSWSYSHHDSQGISLSKGIMAYSAGTLATIIGWTGILGISAAALLSIAVSSIAFVVAMNDGDASIMLVERDVYLSNIIYRKTFDDGYVLYHDNYEKVYNDEVHYFSKDIGL
ncbi:MAG: hypothetical protein U9N81_05660 [Bacillota bacterium]|nr:hypothetical protein [Bacillota bacterium]